jgi:tRNA A37 methylthiotransferase MiaB
MITIQEYMERNGWCLTRNVGRADVVIIATCGVVQANETHSLNAIAKAAKKASPSSTIVISGCLPEINPEAIRKLGDFLFVPSGQLEKLDQIVNARVLLANIKSPDSTKDEAQITSYLVARSFCRKSRFYKRLFNKFNMSSSFLAGSVLMIKGIEYGKSLIKRTPVNKIVPYFNIKIADGCMNACSFCATRFATGGLRSKPLGQIIEEFQSGLQKGYRIFQLIAEDTGCYGLDIGTNLSDLLEQMFRIDGDYQLIIIDCNPRWLVDKHDELMPVLIRNQDKIKALFVPVQSGSDRILKRMRRQYTAEQAKSILREFNERAPKIPLRTSILVGFPGESEEDFEATKQLISEIGFAEVTINRYEDRPNTPSAQMTDKVDQDTIEGRAQFLVQKMNCRLLS